MNLMTLLNIAISTVLLLWMVDTFAVQPWRLRRAVDVAQRRDGPHISEIDTLTTDSPLSQVMGKLVTAVLVAYLLGVIVWHLDVDFALALVLATLSCGLFWLLDVAYLKRMRLKAAEKITAALATHRVEAEPNTAPPLLVEYAASFFPVLAVVLVLRSFLVEPFTIPSGSMLPTLDIGDYILVNKFAYGLRVPVLGNKFLPVGEPQRGDVIVFHYPLHPETNFIKRLVGLPGDHIVIEGRKVIVNGQPLPVELVSQDPDVDPWQQYYREQLGSRSHLIRQLVQNDTSGNAPGMQYTDVTVPAGEYFMMGDNRDESDDSRYWGFVPDRDLVGRADYIWIHKTPGMNLPTLSRDGKVD